MEKIFMNYYRFLSSTFPNLTSMIWMFQIEIIKNMKGKVTWIQLWKSLLYVFVKYLGFLMA